MGEADWFAAIFGIFVLGAGALMAVLGEQVMRIGGFSFIGIAVLGAAFWFGYYRNADAQSPPIVNNAPSINTFNQSGGNNTINVGPSRLPFDPAIGEQIISKLPAGKTIVIQSVGSASDQKVADQYQQFLESRGFTVQRARIGMMAPPPDRQIVLGNPDAPKMAVIIAPSAIP
jgi:hypothetical protein